MTQLIFKFCFDYESLVNNHWFICVQKIWQIKSYGSYNTDIMGRLSMYTLNNMIKHHYHQQQKITMFFIIIVYNIFWIQLYEKHIEKLNQNGFSNVELLSRTMLINPTYNTSCCDYKNINNVVGWYGEGGVDRDGESKVRSRCRARGQYPGFC